jgi:hypothetical protein
VTGRNVLSAKGFFQANTAEQNYCLPYPGLVIWAQFEPLLHWQGACPLNDNFIKGN